MFTTCANEPSWADRDSVENGSDSSGNDTSDCGTSGMLIILRLLYPDSCRKCFSLTLAAFRVSVFHPVAFSDSWDCMIGIHRMPIRSCNLQLVARTVNRLCLRPPDQ